MNSSNQSKHWSDSVVQRTNKHLIAQGSVSQDRAHRAVGVRDRERIMAGRRNGAQDSKMGVWIISWYHLCPQSRKRVRILNTQRWAPHYQDPWDRAMSAKVISKIAILKGTNSLAIQRSTNFCKTIRRYSRLTKHLRHRMHPITLSIYRIIGLRYCRRSKPNRNMESWGISLCLLAQQIITSSSLGN